MKKVHTTHLEAQGSKMNMFLTLGMLKKKKTFKLAFT